MDHLTRLHQRVAYYQFGVMFVVAIICASFGYVAVDLFHWAPLLVTILCIVLAGLLMAVAATWLSTLVLEPTRVLWQLILHLSPAEHGVAAPDMNHLHVGGELAAAASRQLQQMATSAGHSGPGQVNVEMHDFVRANLPLPLFILDEQETIVFANKAAAEYLGQPADQLIGKNVYMILDMGFPSENTLDTWLKEAKQTKATDSNAWERVRLNVLDNHPTRLFDLAAYYNRDNPDHQATMLILFDHTKQYSQDEQAISFIALSVHELRTPLTLLRGYIEAFEEELDGKVDPQLVDFMHKMSATAQQLTSFVNNILNVARIDNDQLELKMHKEDWAQVITSAVSGLSLRAKVRGITLQATVAPDLPPVGIDRLSIHEVINNLVDNAIKYSGDSKLITIESKLNKEGLIETTVTDKGVGINEAIMANLFTKFYRDHRNRAQIGGTGLGLYLSKAIISAHGGNIWVRSKPGEGSTFSFTVLPYDKLAEEVKNSDNGDIVRGAHGWIKNHSMYRR